MCPLSISSSEVGNAGEKLGYVLFVGVIAAVCILPAAVMPWQEENAVGNEQLAPLPELREEDGSFNVNILNEFSDYLRIISAFVMK